jgi:DNA-binding SARP family transcriptional activator
MPGKVKQWTSEGVAGVTTVPRLPVLRVELVGGIRARAVDGRVIAISARKSQALLGCLALRPGLPVMRDHLASLLWDVADQALARSSLRQALANLRRALPPEALGADAKSAWLDAKLVTSDVAEFHELVRANSAGALLETIGRFDGELFAGIDVHATDFDHWAREQRFLFRRQLIEAIERVVAHCNAAGDLAGQLTALERLVRIEPTRERAHRTLMELLVRLGRHTDALRQYRVCRDALRRELDVATEPATEALLRDILRQRRAREEPGPDHVDEIEAAPTRQRVPPTLREAVVLCARCVIGESREVDPEYTQQHWSAMEQRVRTVAEQYGGSVDRVSQGEVLAVFGLVSLSGNEADRATRAGLELTVSSAARSPSSVCTIACGIASGQVLPTALETPFPLTGRAVAVARGYARAAPAGSLLVEAEIAETLETKFTFEPTAYGDQCVAHRVVAVAENSAARPARIFVGRQAELALLTTLLEQVAQSGRARAVAVRGEPGIGKSSLIHALMRRAGSSGVAAHTLQVLDFGQAAADRPIPALMLHLLGVAPDASRDARASAVEQATGSGLLGQEDRLIACDLIGAKLPEEAVSRLAAMDSGTRDGGRSRVLHRLLQHAAAKPLLIAVEDVHWASSHEIAQLADVAAAAAAYPVLIALTSRSADDVLTAAWRARGWACPITTLDLAPLAEDEARELAAAHKDVPGDVVERCLATALGHPLFLEQLLRTARAGQKTLPGSVRGLVLARIERFRPEVQRALQASAVLGIRFSRDALRHVLDDPDFAAQSLEQAGLVAMQADDCRFAHALIRDAVYESLLGSTRRELHRRAASWYDGRDSGVQAEHLAAAGDDGAAAAYVRAAVENQQAYRLDRALAYAERALETARRPEDLCDALATLGDVQLAAGRTSDACASFRRSIELANSGATRARAWLGLATALRIVDRFDEALAAVARAELEVDPADARRLAHLWTLRGNLHFPLGELGLCLAAHERALEFARRAGSIEDVARALGGLGDAHYQRGRLRSAGEHFQQCVDLSEQHGLVGLRLSYLPMVAVTQSYSGEFAAALETCSHAAASAWEVGDRRARLLSLNTRASIELNRAQFAASKATSDLGIALARELGARRFEAEALILNGLAQVGLDDKVQARATLELAVAMARDACPTYCAPWALAALALLSIDAGQRQALLQEGEDLLARDCVSHNYIEFYSLGIEAALRTNDPERTTRYASCLEEYTQAEPLRWADVVIARGRALAAKARNEPGAAAAARAALAAAHAIEFDALVPALQQAING